MWIQRTMRRYKSATTKGDRTKIEIEKKSSFPFIIFGKNDQNRFWTEFRFYNFEVQNFFPVILKLVIFFVFIFNNNSRISICKFYEDSIPWHYQRYSRRRWVVWADLRDESHARPRHRPASELGPVEARDPGSDRVWK